MDANERAGVRRRASGLWSAHLPALIAAIAILPALAGCSSFPSWSSSSSPTSAAVQPAPTAAGAPVSGEPPAQSTVSSTPPPRYSNAAAVPPPSSYADPAATPRAYDPLEDVYPTVSLVDLFKGSQAGQKAAQNPAPAESASALHPPSTYTPSAPPYAANAGPPGVAPPPASTAAAAPADHPYDPRDDVYPTVSLVDLFKNSPNANAAGR